jgi:cyanophycin synthetase
VQILMQEEKAVARAISESTPGDLLLLLVDDIEGATERLKGRSFPHKAAIAERKTVSMTGL